MNDGWVRIYRKLLDNPIMQEPELLQLFMYLILRANYSDNPFFWNSEPITVKRGSFISGRFEIAKALKQNPNTIYKRLQKLEKLGFCNIKSNSKNSLITLLKYDYYQSGQIDENDNRNNTVTTREQQSNTNKKEKKDKNIGSGDFLDFLPNELNTVEFKTVWQSWIKYRAEKKKKITPTQAEFQFKQLINFQSQKMNPVDVINESITKGWTGLFPLKQNKRNEQPEQITSKLKFIDPNQPGWM